MKRLTVSLESPEYEALVEEAERRDVSKSTVAREVFTAWRDNSLTTPSPDADESSPDSHNKLTAPSPEVHNGDGCGAARDAQERLEELEQRVTQLEKASRLRRRHRRRDPKSDDNDDADDTRRQWQPSTTDRDPRSESADRRDSAPRRRDSNSDEARTKRPLPEDVDEAISEWDPPGTGQKARARTTALRVIVEHLREHGSAKKSDLVTNIYDTGRHQASYGSSDGWYNALVKGVGGQTGGVAHVAEQTDRVRPPGDARGSWQWVD